MGRLLALLPALRGTGLAALLGRAPAAQPQRHALGFDSANALRLSPDRPWQRMAIASPLVRAQRDGGSARRGFFPGRNSPALRLPRFDFGTQRRALRSSHAALEGFVQ